MPLFTFALDFAGGTYLSQHAASSPELALERWFDNLLPRETAGGASLDVSLAFSGRPDGLLVPVEGLKRVWCVSASHEAGLALLNIIQTDDT
jgi:hypothetical protein